MTNRKAPSLVRLEAAFPGKGKELRALLKGEVKTETYASVQALVRECYHRPSYSYRLMTAINEIIDGYGIEAISKGDNVVAKYVNLGDAYTTTIIRKISTSTIMIASWGDFAESNGL